MTDIFNLNEIIRELPIERLPLKISLYNKLKGGGVRTVRQLVETLKQSRDLINKSQKELVKAMMKDLHKSLNDDGSPDWKAFCEFRQLPMLPAKVAIESDGEMLKNFGRIIQEILESDPDKRKWQTIQYRYGLNGKKVWTQEELGHGFGGLSRQRVEQLEKKYLRELKQVLLERNYIAKSYMVDERVIEFVGRVRKLVAGKTNDFISEPISIQLLVESAGGNASPDLPALRLLFELLGMSAIRELPRGVPPLWKLDSSYLEARLRKSLKRLEQVLTKDYAPPMEEIELLAKLNRAIGRSESLSAAELHRILPLCDYIEITADGRYQARIEWIQSRAGQAERLLEEAGEPVNVRVLTQRLNQKLSAAGLKTVNELNFGNIMSDDKRFVAEAKSGRRGLRRWGSVTNKSIRQLIEAALSSAEKPLSESEIYEYASEQRAKVSRKSIAVYLASESKFKKVGFDKWQLASASSSNNNQTDDIGAAVIAEFDRKGVATMPFPELVSELSKRLRIPENSLRGILRHHPVVSGHRPKSSRTTIATLNRGYQPNQPRARKERRRKLETLYEKTEKLVKELLMNEPSKELELSFLHSELQSRLGLNRQTAYQYVSKIPFVEKIPVAGTTVRICRLKSNDVVTYPKVAEIKLVNPISGNEAQRAVSKLNEAEVDIGLFLLGKSFEASIKSYLLEVEQTGTQEIVEGNLKGLNNMIAWVKKQEIVTDGPTLSYLQAQRNDRAHGVPPSAAERKRLLDSAPWGADLYLTYILLFETLRRDLVATKTNAKSS